MNSERKKVLIIQQKIPHYRVPIFNRLADYYDLTVAAQDFKREENYQFQTQKIELTNYGPFVKIKNFKSLKLEEYTDVIFTFNVRIIDLIRVLITRYHTQKIILWGIGVSSDNGYDNSRKYDWLRYWAAKRSKALLFYSKYPIQKYKVEGNIPENKMFIANNTIDLHAQIFTDEKKYFLFVGTLNKNKRVDHLIRVYTKAKSTYPLLPKLHIVGDGPCMNDLLEEISKLGLEEAITIHGSVTDAEVLKSIYRKAIACISPSQAGLSVLQSLSMGVPFITNHNAITGGERFNIVHGENGYLVKSDEDLIEILIHLGKDLSKAVEMGKNAYEHFKTNCTVDKMIQGFTNAINYKND